MPKDMSKQKKCITLIDCVLNAVSSEKENVRKMYSSIVDLIKLQDSGFSAPLDEPKDFPRHNIPEHVHQEIQVEVSKIDRGTNTVGEQKLEVNSRPVTNGVSQVCFPNIVTSPTEQCGQNTEREKGSAPKNTSKNRSTFDPNVIIKVEDSGSEDSTTSEELHKTEHLVNRMMAPESAVASKTFLHFVLIENLPPRTSTSQVTEELLVGLLGIQNEDVTGITVHQEKTESIAQIYFKDIKHVQRVLVFSGKLVFNGRVIISRIGSATS